MRPRWGSGRSNLTIAAIPCTPSPTIGNEIAMTTIFLALIDVVVAAERQGDQARLDELAWFTRACGDEIDETARTRLDG